MIRNLKKVLESLIEGETKETAEQSFKKNSKKRFDILKIIEKCPGQRKDIAAIYIMFLRELNAKFKLDKPEEEIEKVGSVDNVRHILDDLVKWGKIKKKETKRYPIYYFWDIQEVIIKFREKYGREPTKEEIAYEIGKSPHDKKFEEELYKIAKEIGWKESTKEPKKIFPEKLHHPFSNNLLKFQQLEYYEKRNKLLDMQIKSINRSKKRKSS